MLGRACRQGVLVLFVFLCLGCGKTPVAQDLTQRQANEIVALLSSKGIVAIAHKESGGRGLFSVQINPDQYPSAASLLHERGLPSEARPSARELLTPHGIIPSSRQMEAMRLDYVLASQIEEMLQSHAAVSQARSVVRLNFVQEGQAPSASVVIELRAGAPAVDREVIAALVQRAIPGIPPENLSITISASTEPASTAVGSHLVAADQLVDFLWFWRVPAGDYLGLALLFSVALLLVGAAAVAVGYWLCLFQRTREGVEPNLPEVFSRSLRVERARRDLPE